MIKTVVPVVTCVLLVVLPQVAIADIVALYSGERIEGVVSNREQLVSNLQMFDKVSILPDGETELRRFNVADVDYVLLIDGDARRVIDFGRTGGAGTLTGANTQQEYSSRSVQPPTDPGTGKKEGGVALMIIGTAAIAVGALVKFGGPKIEFTESGIDVSEDSYNAGNYALMIGGGIAFLGGLMLLQSGQEASDTYGLNQSVRIGVVLAEF